MTHNAVKNIPMINVTRDIIKNWVNPKEYWPDIRNEIVQNIPKNHGARREPFKVILWNSTIAIAAQTLRMEKNQKGPSQIAAKSMGMPTRLVKRRWYIIPLRRSLRQTFYHEIDMISMRDLAQNHRNQANK